MSPEKILFYTITQQGTAYGVTAIIGQIGRNSTNRIYAGFKDGHIGSWASNLMHGRFAGAEEAHAALIKAMQIKLSHFERIDAAREALRLCIRNQSDEIDAYFATLETSLPEQSS